jgi:hypothetical protein
MSKRKFFKANCLRNSAFMADLNFRRMKSRRLALDEAKKLTKNGKIFLPAKSRKSAKSAWSFEVDRRKPSTASSVPGN